MKYALSCLLILFLLSCSAGKKVELKPVINVKSKPEKNKTTVMEFATIDGQDRADIKLSLFEDQTFKFRMTIFSPESQDKNVSEFSGRWSEKDDQILITFNGKKPILSALFEHENNSIQFINESSFSFKSDRRDLIIWDLRLDRI